MTVLRQNQAGMLSKTISRMMSMQGKNPCAILALHTCAYSRVACGESLQRLGDMIATFSRVLFSSSTGTISCSS